MKYTFEFTENDLQIIMDSLNEMPHKFVRNVIDNISTQYAKQTIKKETEKVVN